MRSDVLYFDSLIVRNEYSCLMADSMINMLEGNPSNTANIYYLARTVKPTSAIFIRMQKHSNK